MTWVGRGILHSNKEAGDGKGESWSSRSMTAFPSSGGFFQVHSTVIGGHQKQSAFHGCPLPLQNKKFWEILV